MHYKSKWDGAVPQARVLFFDLLTVVFLIAFVEKLVPELLFNVLMKRDYELIRLWQLLFRKSNYFLGCGK
jgi:hypothetical protein